MPLLVPFLLGTTFASFAAYMGFAWLDEGEQTAGEQLSSILTSIAVLLAVVTGLYILVFGPPKWLKKWW